MATVNSEILHRLIQHVKDRGTSKYIKRKFEPVLLTAIATMSSPPFAARNDLVTFIRARISNKQHGRWSMIPEIGATPALHIQAVADAVASEFTADQTIISPTPPEDVARIQKSDGDQDPNAAIVAAGKSEHRRDKLEADKKQLENGKKELGDARKRLAEV